MTWGQIPETSGKQSRAEPDTVLLRPCLTSRVHQREVFVLVANLASSQERDFIGCRNSKVSHEFAHHASITCDLVLASARQNALQVFTCESCRGGLFRVGLWILCHKWKNVRVCHGRCGMACIVFPFRKLGSLRTMCRLMPQFSSPFVALSRVGEEKR